MGYQFLGLDFLSGATPEKHQEERSGVWLVGYSSSNSNGVTTCRVMPSIAIYMASAAPALNQQGKAHGIPFLPGVWPHHMLVKHEERTSEKRRPSEGSEAPTTGATTLCKATNEDLTGAHRFRLAHQSTRATTVTKPRSFHLPRFVLVHEKHVASHFWEQLKALPAAPRTLVPLFGRNIMKIQMCTFDAEEYEVGNKKSKKQSGEHSLEHAHFTVASLQINSLLLHRCLLFPPHHPRQRFWFRRTTSSSRETETNQKQ